MSLRSFLRWIEVTTRPVHPVTRRVLEERWAALPSAARTAAQTVGRHAVGCEGTHGVFPRCNLTCSPCYHSKDANKVRVDGRHTLTQVEAQMRLLQERRGPRAHAQLIGGEVSLLDPDDHAAALLVMRDATSTVWVFPFSKPLAPAPGDNQALAVNTEDGTVVYDVAFALVWVEDGQAALNTNEAYAFASCTSCASVAIAFQVVLVLGDNDTAVPQNLAGSLNYDCVNCLTYSLAQQLFVTLTEPLSEDAMADLDALWQEIAAYGADIEQAPLEEIAATLDQFAAQILSTIESDQTGTLPSSDSSPSVSPEPSDDSSPTPDATATSSEPASPTDSPTPSPSESDTSPTVTTSTEPTPSPTASPTG